MYYYITSNHICVNYVKYFEQKSVIVLSTSSRNLTSRDQLAATSQYSPVRARLPIVPRLSCLFIRQKWISRSNKCRIELRVIGFSYQSIDTSAIVCIFRDWYPEYIASEIAKRVKAQNGVGAFASIDRCKCVFRVGIAMDECRECRIELRTIVFAVSDRSTRLYVASRWCEERSKKLRQISPWRDIRTRVKRQDGR